MFPGIRHIMWRRPLSPRFSGSNSMSLNNLVSRIAATLLSALLVPLAVDAGAVDYTRDIQPLLSEKCASCHGAIKQEAGLRLDDQSSATSELDSGQRAIVPGDPASSELIRRISSDDEGERMPPEDSNKPALSQEEQRLLKQWILDGAKYDDFWSFVPLAASPPRFIDYDCRPWKPRHPWRIRPATRASGPASRATGDATWR